MSRSEIQTRYQTILDDQIDLVCRFLPDGTLTFVNRAYCDYFGLSREELTGFNFFGLIPEKERAAAKKSLAGMTPENPIRSYEHVVVDRHGRRRWQRWTDRGFFDEQGRPVEFQSTGQDITEIKQAEEELQRYADTLEQRVAERTEELARLNEQLQQDIRQRQKTELAFQEAHKKLKLHISEEQKQRQIAESLQEIATILNSSLDQAAVLTRILDQLGRVIDYDGAAIYLPDGDDLVISDAAGISKRYIGHRTPRASREPAVQVFQTKRPLVIRDTLAYEDWMVWDEADTIRSWMGAPLLAGDKAIGLLTIDNEAVGVYQTDNVKILEAFAGQAVIAIENTRLYRQAQSVAAAEERSRLARDLHDAVNQTLFSASIIAEAMPRIWDEDPDQGRRGLAELRQLTRGALAEMRTLLLELRPKSLTEKKMGELLSHLTGAASSRSRVPVKLSVKNDTLLPPKVQVALYRIAQEALNNIAKHSGATRAEVNLTCRPEQVTLHIHDNGRGFNPDEIPPEHLGLGIMRERADQVGATLKIASQPDRGTKILAIWPESLSPPG